MKSIVGRPATNPAPPPQFIASEVVGSHPCRMKNKIYQREEDLLMRQRPGN